MRNLLRRMASPVARTTPRACPPAPWLPARATRPDVSGRVEWLDFNGVVPEEPFFTQTVARLRASRAPVETDLADLASLPVSDAAPAGCIFHVGRCGSTLISNGLMLAAGTAVVAEPELVSSVLMLSRETTSSAMGDAARCQRALLSGALSRYLDVWRTRRLVFKFTSWNLLHLEMVMSLWPRAPYVIVIREPRDVAASLAIKPTPWLMGHGAQGPGRDQSFAGEYAAVMLSTYLQTALRRAGDSRCRIVDYAMITPEMVERIGACFGAPLSAAAFARVKASFAVYSKDPTRQRSFAGDSTAKRAAADDGASAEAMTRWGVQAMYTELRAMAARPWT